MATSTYNIRPTALTMTGQWCERRQRCRRAPNESAVSRSAARRADQDSRLRADVAAGPRGDGDRDVLAGLSTLRLASTCGGAERPREPTPRVERSSPKAKRAEPWDRVTHTNPHRGLKSRRSVANERCAQAVAVRAPTGRWFFTGINSPGFRLASGGLHPGLALCRSFRPVVVRRPRFFIAPMHVIRLRGPWEYEPLVRVWIDASGARRESRESLPAAGRAHLPADWGLTLGPDFRGRVRYTRRFGLPTNLEPHEEVWLVVEGVDYFGSLALNDTPLGDVTGYFRAAGRIQRHGRSWPSETC